MNTATGLAITACVIALVISYILTFVFLYYCTRKPRGYTTETIVDDRLECGNSIRPDENATEHGSIGYQMPFILRPGTPASSNASSPSANSQSGQDSPSGSVSSSPTLSPGNSPPQAPLQPKPTKKDTDSLTLTNQLKPKYTPSKVPSYPETITNQSKVMHLEGTGFWKDTKDDNPYQ